MRLTVSEKQEIIHMVTRSEIGVNRTLREIGINKSTFYNWYHAYSEKGIEGLIHISKLIGSEEYKIGQKIKVFVERINKKERRMSLLLPQTARPVTYR